MGYMRQAANRSIGQSNGGLLSCKVIKSSWNEFTHHLSPPCGHEVFFLPKKLIIINGLEVFTPHLKNLWQEKMFFVAPDQGTWAEVAHYATYFKSQLIRCKKIG